VLIVGDSSSTENFIRLIKNDSDSPYNVVGIISIKDSSVGRRIHNIPILSSVNKISLLNDVLKKEKKNLPQRIIISDANIDPKFVELLYIFSKQNGLAIGILPKISDISINKTNKFVANPIVIEDVLGRKQKVNNPKIISREKLY